MRPERKQIEMKSSMIFSGPNNVSLCASNSREELLVESFAFLHKSLWEKEKKKSSREKSSKLDR